MDNKNYDFIETYKGALNDSICDQLIDYYENNMDRAQERTDFQKSLNIHDMSLQLVYDVKEPGTIKLLKEIDDVLWNCFSLYKKKYERSATLIHDTGIINSVVKSFKIQKTLPGEGYMHWHSEKMYDIVPGAADSYRRFLVYTIYLNDINDGGETEFYYEKKKVKPEKGKVCLFPADFSYVHRGYPPKSETKYILTGWFLDGGLKVN